MEKESVNVPPTAAPPSGAHPAPAGRALMFLLAAFLIVLAVLAGITMVSRQRASAQLESDTLADQLPTVSVIHPKRTPAQLNLELPGDITAFEEAPIYSRVSGYLKAWYTDIGTHVTAGQLLAEIDTPELDQEIVQAEAALAQTKANLEIARISAQRWQDLRKSDSVSQQDTDVKVATWSAQQANVQAAEANLQRLKEMANFKKLVAPFPGIITVRTMDSGTLITAGSSREIFRLAKIDPLRVYISLPQAYSQMVQTNDEATVTFTELPGEKFMGKVDRTAGAIDPVSRTLTTEILVANQEGKLFPGAHAMVQIRLVNAAEPVIVPVNTLLFRNEQGVQAGVVDVGGVVHLTDVTMGRDYGTTVEIVHGLSESDNVILNPSDSLMDGAQVRIADSGADAAKTADKSSK